jgi:hypothetical protein
MLKTVTSELVKYKLDLMVVQEFRCYEGGSQPADHSTFSYGNGSANHHLGIGFTYIRDSHQQLTG